MCQELDEYSAQLRVLLPFACRESQYLAAFGGKNFLLIPHWKPYPLEYTLDITDCLQIISSHAKALGCVIIFYYRLTWQTHAL